MYQAGQSQNLCDAIKNWWKRLGAFSRVILFCLLGTYIASWFFWPSILKFANIPLWAIYRSKFLGLITAPFLCISIIGLVF